MKQIRRKKLFEEVMSSILDMVKSNELKTGDKIQSEKELGDMLGVSRMVIREALSALQSNGFLEVKHGSGIYLKNIDVLLYNGDLEVYAGKQQIIHIMEVRKGLEGEGAYLAALRSSEEDRAELQQILHDMFRAISAGENASDEDYQFHAKLMAVSQNPFYVKIFNDIVQPSYYDVLKSSHQFFSKTIGPRLVIVKEHQEILDCINTGQAHKARQTMWEHLDSVESKMRKLFHLQRD